MGNKLKTALSNFGKKVPALIFAGMVTCAAAQAESPSQSDFNKALSIGNKTVTYLDAADKYSAKASENTMKAIIDSDLNNVKTYNYDQEAEVKNEVAGHLADQNANTLKLAKLYKAMEESTVLESGLTDEKITEIAKNLGKGTPDSVNVYVYRSGIQHFLHLILDTETLIRFRADKAEIQSIDEYDGKNEFANKIQIKINSDGKLDIREAMKDLLSASENYIIEYAKYEHNVNHKDGAKIAKQIKKNFDSIKDLVAKGNLTPAQYQRLKNLIVETADLLPEAMFGTQSMRRGLIIEFASSYAMNHTFNILAACGHDINNITPVHAKKDVNVDVKGITTSTDKHFTLGTNVSADIQLNKDWDLKVGGELDWNKSYDNDFAPDSTQLFATAEIGRTFATENNKHRVAAELKTGMQFDAMSISAPFGGSVIYSWTPNQKTNKWSIDAKFSGMFNVQTALADIGAAFGATYHGRNWNIGFFVGFGKTINMNQGKSTPAPIPTPVIEQPDPHTDGEDEITIPEEDPTTDPTKPTSGPMDELPEKDR